MPFTQFKFHRYVRVMMGWLVFYFLTVPVVFAAPKTIAYSEFSYKCKLSTFVDKTLFIKELLEDSGQKLVITAPKGFGKTANLQMLKAFLQLEVDRNGKRITKAEGNQPVKDTNNYKLFNQLKIANHPTLMQKYFGKHPVIYLDYKAVEKFFYLNETQNFFKDILHETYVEHGYLQNSEKLFDDEKDHVKRMCSDDYREEDTGSLIPGIEKLSKYLFKHFDRTKVFVLIDHYDSPIYTCVFDPDVPRLVFKHVIDKTQVLFNMKKDDFYIDTFFITGVSQIAESHPVYDNVIKRYEFLNEHRFVPYYGFTEDEVFDILGRYTIEVDNDMFDEVQKHYGGYISYNNITIHNTWSILRYLEKQRFDHVWPKKCGIPNLNLLVKLPEIYSKLERLLKDLETVMDLKKLLSFDNLFMLRDLVNEPNRGNDHLWYTVLFYSFMFEHGFFSYDPSVKSAVSDARRYLIPNEEIKEFLWKAVNESC